MPVGTLLPARFHSTSSTSTSSKPSWLNQHISPLLQSLSRSSYTHPIHTLVFIVLLASTSYIGLLETSIFEAQTASVSQPGHIDFDSLAESGRQLRVGRDTNWKWHALSHSSSSDDQVRVVVDDFFAPTDGGQFADHLALVTLVFPKSLSHNSPQVAPLPESIPLPSGSSAKAIPSTANPFSPISQDSTLAYSIGWRGVSAFLDSIQEIPEQRTSDAIDGTRKWIATTPRQGRNGAQGSIRRWLSNAWTEFIDLLKVRRPVSGLYVCN